MRLLLASPRGFCAGVDRAIAILDQMLEASGERVFVHHEIVHNRAVVDRLKARGAVFVENVSDIPVGALAVVSAHGAPPAVFAQAETRKLRLMDATCPLVSKVHLDVKRHARQGRSVVVIGHRDHVEVRGIVAHHPASGDTGIVVVENEQEARLAEVPTPDRLGYVTQTTLAVDQTKRIVDVLRERFPGLVEPHADDICYATQNRQAALPRIAPECDLILILGAPHSSNSVRLLEVARGVRPEAIEPAWLQGVNVVGLTSSASAPEHLVQGTIVRLREMVAPLHVETVGEPEDVRFRLPAPSRNWPNGNPR